MSDDDLALPIETAREWATRGAFWIESYEPIYVTTEPDLTSPIRMVIPTRVEAMRLTLASYGEDGRIERQTITVPGYVMFVDQPLLLAAFPLIDQQEPAPETTSSDF